MCVLFLWAKICAVLFDKDIYLIRKRVHYGKVEDVIN